MAKYNMHDCVNVFADYLEAALRNLKYNTPGLVTSLDVAKQHFGNKSKAKLSDEQSPVPYSRRKSIQRFQTRIVREFVNIN